MANTTWNPSDKTSGITLGGTNNLAATITGFGGQNVRAIDFNTTGKFYFEFNTATAVNNCWMGLCAGTVGIGAITAQLAGVASLGAFGAIAYNGTAGPVIASIPNNNVVGWAVDIGAQLFWVRVTATGSWNATSGSANNPATGTGGLPLTGVAGAGISGYPMFGGSNAATMTLTANFGDSAFLGAVPSGFTPGFAPGGGSGGGSTAQARAMVLA